MADQTDPPVTLGDKLRPHKPRSQRSDQRAHVSRIALIAVILLISAVISFLFWYVFNTLYPALAVLIISDIDLFIIFVSFIRSKNSTKGGEQDHFLTNDDQQGFMSSLRLSDKTAIFDGSNIYHFGLDNGLGRKALQLLIDELRSDGYRLICFFDANIYHTLLEHGEFIKTANRFSITILQRIFGLKENEIYVVPRGNQADKFIIESLTHLPISFAVTNDRFRDYQTEYDFLTKDTNWRKGLKIQQGRLHLYKYKFKRPILIA
jgi:hypothetical protein